MTCASAVRPVLDFAARATEQSRSGHQTLALRLRRLIRHERGRSASTSSKEVTRVTRSTSERGRRGRDIRFRWGHDRRNGRRRRCTGPGRRGKVGVPSRVGDRRRPVAPERLVTAGAAGTAAAADQGREAAAEAALLLRRTGVVRRREWKWRSGRRRSGSQGTLSRSGCAPGQHIVHLRQHLVMPFLLPDMKTREAN